VTGLVDALADTGFVARRPHPTDRRATLVTLTVRGTRLAQTWNTGYEELAIDPSAGIAPTQLTDLAATPDQVVARLGTSNREEETKSSKS